MDLVYECTYRADLDAQKQMVGPGPFGTRVVSTVTGGWCKGERLNGTFGGAAGDGMLSVRMVLRDSMFGANLSRTMVQSFSLVITDF